MNDQKLQQALVTLGFSAEEATHQTNELNQLILQAVALRLAKESGQSKITIEELEQLYTNHQQGGSLKAIVEEESTRIIGEYIDRITAKLSPEQKQQFVQTTL